MLNHCNFLFIIHLYRCCFEFTQLYLYAHTYSVTYVRRKCIKFSSVLLDYVIYCQPLKKLDVL